MNRTLKPLRLVDVSEWQGAAVDWEALREQGIDAGIAKCTEGSGYLDRCFARNWAAIKAAGLLRAAYHFCRFDLGTSARQEASWLLAHLPPLDAGDVLILDVETPTSGPGSFDAAVIALAGALAHETGAQPWLYTGQWYAQGLGRLTSAELARLPLWTAAYGPEQPAPYAPWGKLCAWQHTDSASLRGVGSCDESYFFGNASEFRALGYPAPPAGRPAPAPAPTPHWKVVAPTHLRPRPQLDAVPLGPLLPAGTFVAECDPPPGWPAVTAHWKSVRTGGDIHGYVFAPDVVPDPAHH